MICVHNVTLAETGTPILKGSSPVKFLFLKDYITVYLLARWRCRLTTNQSQPHGRSQCCSKPSTSTPATYGGKIWHTAYTFERKGYQYSEPEVSQLEPDQEGNSNFGVIPVHDITWEIPGMGFWLEVVGVTTQAGARTEPTQKPDFSQISKGRNKHSWTIGMNYLLKMDQSSRLINLSLPQPNSKSSLKTTLLAT